MSKSVMTVMTVGLVAMLGAEAEAHYIVVNGRCYWHSGECVRKDKEAEDFKDNKPPISEVVAKVTEGEILCADGNVEVFDLSKNPVTLAARKPIVQADITERRDAGTIISRNLEWYGIVSDALFLEDPSAFNFCPNSSPQDMIIRSMSVEMNLYLDSKQSTPHSALALTCKLPGFTFMSPPNPPPRGAPFDCTVISTCHGKEGVGCK